MGQVSVGIALPGVSIGINVPVYPELVRVPGYPVYYAPQLGANFFFYDGMKPVRPQQTRSIRASTKNVFTAYSATS